MRTISLLVPLCCVLLAGCATTSPSSSSDIFPAQAVIAAAERPISGTFMMNVKGSGRQDDRLFLNSEADYRDQRCLTIQVPKDVATELQAKLAGAPAVILKGRKIRVSGTAQRVQI